jgi:hypothetical protein
METKIEKRANTKQVPDGTFKNITVYITEDGEKFYSSYDAENHEKGIIVKENKNRMAKISQVYGSCTDIEGTFYLAKNEEELEFLKNSLGFHLQDRYHHSIVEGNIETGKWFMHRYEDAGDSGDYNYFTSWEEILKEFRDLVKQLENKQLE